MPRALPAAAVAAALPALFSPAAAAGAVKQLKSMQDLVMLTKREQVSLIAIGPKDAKKSKKMKDALAKAAKQLGDSPGFVFGYAEQSAPLLKRYEMSEADIPAVVAVTIFDEEGVRKGGKKHRTVMQPPGKLPTADALVRFAHKACLPPFVEPFKNSGPDEGARARLGMQVPMAKLLLVRRKGQGAKDLERVRAAALAAVVARRGDVQGVAVDLSDSEHAGELLSAWGFADSKASLLYADQTSGARGEWKGEAEPTDEAVAAWVDGLRSSGGGGDGDDEPLDEL